MSQAKAVPVQEWLLQANLVQEMQLAVVRQIFLVRCRDPCAPSHSLIAGGGTTTVHLTRTSLTRLGRAGLAGPTTFGPRPG